MIIGIPRESHAGETRVAATPQTIGQLLKLGYSVVVESGAGDASSFSDAAYVGAGVAGLAAIGAAGSMGAIVRATDPRPEVADQVKSLGGEYLYVDPAAAEASATGYAEEMGDDYKAREAALYAEQTKDVDIIITTALIPGRPAPRIITGDMVASMKPGSVIVDMAAANGGNVEGTVKDQAVVTDNGVTS